MTAVTGIDQYNRLLRGFLDHLNLASIIDPTHSILGVATYIA